MSNTRITPYNGPHSIHAYIRTDTFHSIWIDTSRSQPLSPTVYSRADVIGVSQPACQTQKQIAGPIRNPFLRLQPQHAPCPRLLNLYFFNVEKENDIK